MSRRNSDSNAAKATPDVFVGLLFVSVASLITGIILLVLELNEELHQHLVRQFPGARVVCADAGNLSAIAQSQGFTGPDSADAVNGADAVVPDDLYIPGWPPHPITILDGLLRLLGRLENDRQGR